MMAPNLEDDCSSNQGSRTTGAAVASSSSSRSSQPVETHSPPGAEDGNWWKDDIASSLDSKFSEASGAAGRLLRFIPFSRNSFFLSPKGFPSNSSSAGSVRKSSRRSCSRPTSKSTGVTSAGVQTQSSISLPQFATKVGVSILLVTFMYLYYGLFVEHIVVKSPESQHRPKPQGSVSVSVAEPPHLFLAPLKGESNVAKRGGRVRPRINGDESAMRIQIPVAEDREVSQSASQTSDVHARGGEQPQLDFNLTGLAKNELGEDASKDEAAQTDKQRPTQPLRVAGEIHGDTGGGTMS